MFLTNSGNVVRLIGVLEEIMVVSETENNEQIDADILQCKADIFRARDIMPGTSPPYKKKPHQKPKSQKTDENIIHPADAAEISTQEEKKTREDTSSTPIETTDSKAPPPSLAEQEKTEIPRFDLAEEIMAEQRKITAIRRKAPGKKTKAQEAELQAGPVGYTVEQPTPGQSEQTRIIAEIVTRDIERLCRGDTLGSRGQNFKDTNRDTN